MSPIDFCFVLRTIDFRYWLKTKRRGESKFDNIDLNILLVHGYQMSEDKKRDFPLGDLNLQRHISAVDTVRHFR